jgi:hemerythrin
MLSSTKQENKMSLLWEKDLETGYPLIDSQHKRFLDVVNDLYSACIRQESPRRIEKAAACLTHYTAKHCFDEEGLQILYEYPDYAHHHGCHREFRKTIEDVSANLKGSYCLADLVERIRTRIGDYMLNHIRTEDRKFINYIKEQSEKAYPKGFRRRSPGSLGSLIRQMHLPA